LCGFSNPGSIGILIGALVTMAPEKKNAITEVAFRAFIAGCVTCFLTASIAGKFLHSVLSTFTLAALVV
jgi:nucleoside permease NupC